ncbi:MAG: UvrD-helicase domain-containing protein, partial [Bacteroidota bacterium]
MSFLADLHIHSHFSRATSAQCRPGPLAAAAARKGLTLIGTGDCTHAGWRAELAEELVEAEEGLYRLREAAGPAADVRFAVTGEISCIYKQDGKTRKIHHVLLLPSLAAAELVGRRLEERGVNLRSDGRPITGLDSRTLLAVILEAEPRAMLIPAHIWTPHFSLFGANSGFDAIEECFGDLAPAITAYETGLSSDPPMNWRLSALDRLTLISSSDAHSPEKLGREAVEFEAELSFPGLAAALRGERGRVLGTIEFYPEEGKYHYDGHRNCGVCWHPRETASAGGICRVCGRPVTIGVLHRAMALADRPEDYRPQEAPPYTALVPLLEVLAEVMGTSPASGKIRDLYERLVDAVGPEIHLLREADLRELSRVGGPLVAEAVRRVRAGEIEFRPGFDGEYGALTIFRPEERRRLAGQAALFALPVESAREGGRSGPVIAAPAKEARAGTDRSAAGPLEALDEEQRRAVTATAGPVLVAAGPGAGKTRTLVQRIQYLLAKGVPPGEITAVTFTHRAADEMLGRLAGTGGKAGRVWVGTFHRLCLEILAERDGKPPLVLDERETAAILAEIGVPAAETTGRRRSKTGAEISLLKSRGIQSLDPDVPPQLREVYRLYQERLAEMGACDYDDIILAALAALRADAALLARSRRRAGHLLVDEFQDVSPAQYDLIRILAGDGANLFLIGDPDQAIYGFRGADSRCFDRLIADYPACVCCRLERNYRSLPPIVKAAAAFAGAGGMCAVRSGGCRPRYIEADGPRAEAKAVIKEIERLVGGTGMLAADSQSGRGEAHALSLGEIAILFRTSHQARPLEEALLTEGIPYRVLGDRAILGAPEVREALDILRYVDKPNDLRYQIALRGSRFDPGPGPWKRIQDAARGRGISLLQATEELLRAGSFTISQHDRIQAFFDLARELEARRETATTAELLLAAAPPLADGPSRALLQAARALGRR